MDIGRIMLKRGYKQPKQWLKKLPLAIVILAYSLPSHALDMLQAYDLAVTNDPTWLAQKNQFLAQQQNEGIVRGELLPQAALNAKWQRSRFEPDITQSPTNPMAASGDITASQKQIGVGLTQALYRPALWQKYSEAKLGTQLNELKLLQQQQELAKRVSQSYLAVLRAEAMATALNSEVNALTAQNRQMQARLKVGVVAKTDVQETEAQLKMVEAAVVAANANVTSYKENLAILLGAPVNQLAPLLADFTPDLLEQTDSEYWQSLANKHSLSLQLAQTNFQLAQQRQKTYNANRYPTVDLFANAGWNDTSNPMQTASNGKNYAAGIEVNLPILTGGRTTLALKQAAYQRDAAADQLLLAQRQIAAALKQHLLQVQAQQQTVNARKVALTASHTVTQASQKGYDLGVRTIVDVLLAQRQYFAAKRDLINAQFDYLNAIVELKATTGVLQRADIALMNSKLVPVDKP